MHGNFRVEGNRLLFNSGIQETIKHYLNPSYHTQQVMDVAEFFIKFLETAQGNSQQVLVKKANDFIAHYRSDKSVAKIVRSLDRRMYSYRLNPGYIHPQNHLEFTKWMRASQPAEIFQRFPDFAEFLNRSKLLSQIKVTRDTLRIIDGQPAMLVEGEWTGWESVKERFHIEKSSLYGTTFVTDPIGMVYTYLDNRLGLQKYHPYQTIGEIPISVIGESEIDSLREIANRFVRPEEARLSQEELDALNRNRPFVLQFVTSYTRLGESNFHQTVLNPRHAYARIVAGADLAEYNVSKGDVFEFGFGLKRGVFLPLKATQGHFCSPDPWEYADCEKRYVTCAPISKEEAAAGFEFALYQQRKHVQLGRKIDFRLTQQNCTVFDKKIGEQAGIAIPTEILLKPLLIRILPECLKRLRETVAKLGTYTPGSLICAIEMIQGIYKKARDALMPFLPLPIQSLWDWLDLFNYRYNLPIILQEWQEKQPSTFIVENPVRLTILPHS